MAFLSHCRKHFVLSLALVLTTLIGAVPTTAEARDDRQRAESLLVPTANGSLRASGEIEVERRRNRLEFKVEIEDVAPGDYDLIVDGVARGVLQARPVPGGVEAELEFRDPPQRGKIPLDFDPMGVSIEIRQGGITVLSGVSPDLGPYGTDSDDNSQGNQGNNGGPVGDFNKQRVKAMLFATDAFPPARGEMELKVSKKKAKLIIKTLALPAGVYDVCFDGLCVGTLETGPRNGIGQAKFSTSQRGNDQQIDFDPVGVLVEISLDGEVFLQGALEGEDLGGGMNKPGIAEVNLTPTAEAIGASGDAEYRLRSNRIDFKVEIEDVPVGTYTLLINGVAVASFQVVNTATGPEGEVEFRDPPEPGKLLLDFDPLGATIQVSGDSGDIVLGATMPDRPAGVD